MIVVKVELWTAEEMAEFSECMMRLQQQRTARLFEQAKASIAAPLESAPASEPELNTPKPAPTKKAAAKQSSKEKARAATKKAAPQAEPATPPDAAAVRTAIRGLIESKGAPAAHELLTEFGATRASDVAEERRAEFIQQCKERSA